MVLDIMLTTVEKSCSMVSRGLHSCYDAAASCCLCPDVSYVNNYLRQHASRTSNESSSHVGALMQSERAQVPFNHLWCSSRLLLPAAESPHTPANALNVCSYYSTMQVLRATDAMMSGFVLYDATKQEFFAAARLLHGLMLRPWVSLKTA